MSLSDYEFEHSTTGEEVFGPAILKTQWFYDPCPSDYSEHMGTFVKKDSRQYWYDRKRGALYGPNIKIQRTFTQREIAVSEGLNYERKLVPKKIARESREVVKYEDGGFDVIHKTRYVEVEGYKNIELTEERFAAVVASYFLNEDGVLDEDEYPEVIGTVRLEDTYDPEELEWVFVELYEDGTARYELDAPELLDSSAPLGYDSDSLRYVEDFQHLEYMEDDADRTERIKYVIDDLQRLDGLQTDSWTYVVARITAEIHGVEVACCDTYGVESDAGDEHHLSILKDLREQVISELQRVYDNRMSMTEDMLKAYEKLGKALEEEKQKNG